ncbi:putative polyketide synthase [Gordonia polyisoprenivorans NBRC 16320 = JCM 10675]|uniref:Type I polyketide synthase n=2 Tax=Gordonia polyisoprenivorans TaxID=84595 RepID=A0A846WL85_9ACTN|nr:type I polyketide synthase [Gordonia polyisoprenivorans]NKY02415.1 type I polyketide synthase [Gordonia polyisoprenivorans]GAB26081.1 putative polyketide synthase [Gordonia polyisoprenivorans NBRC 16320 = JCM 10675]
MPPETSDRRAIITDALRKIDDLSRKLAIAEQGDREPIAIIGMGCRLPGDVDDPGDYWDLLTEGRSGVVRVPENRWDADEFYAEDHTIPGTIVNRVGGFLTHWDPDEFDAEFFGLTPREAIGMDPQQRLLMEVAWECIEDAGLTRERLRGTATGVYVGMTTNDYTLTFAGAIPRTGLDPYIPFGNAANFAAGRLSYFLGLNGPAIVSDTACSSSLVSIHLACQGLRRREIDSALAGGVNLNLSPENSIACSRWGMLAPDGTCKTFDADANGYVRSEGCGVVVLKRLSDAVRDGDRIRAVIRGTGVNQDGASSGQTVPNGPAQQALIRSVLAASDLAPAEIDYVEAHGTGTPLGDPIELDALHGVFAERGDSAPLVLGSVKTNLGHLESASGIAGLIKTVLAIEHAHIPRQLHFSALNPHACEGASRFVIAAEPQQWPQSGRPRRAGVSSFGVSGTNAHVVLEQAPEVAAEPTPFAVTPGAVTPVPATAGPGVHTLIISGKTPERVAAQAHTLADWIGGDGAQVDLSAIAHTLAHHRSRFGVVATVTARDHTRAETGLRALAGGYRAPGVVPAHEGTCPGGTVFVFSGQGSQWAGMGRRLLVAEPAFAAAVVELEPVFVAVVGFSLREVLASGEPVVGIDRIQPVLVGVQLALVSLWRSYGVCPDAVIGHSMGEVAAAVVSGALSVADGLSVIATRSRLMKALSGQGAMALVGLDADAADQICSRYPDLTIAVHAAPDQTVLAGPPEQIDAAIAEVAARDLLARRVEVDVASHHPIIDPVLPELRAALSGLTPTEPTIPMLSTADPDGATSPVVDADYWCANLRNPVRFTERVAQAGATHATFIEMSPHPLLAHAIDATLADRHHHTIGSLARDTDDVETFFTNLAATQTLRSPAVPDTGAFTRLPKSPWMHSRYWVEVPAAEPHRADSHHAGPPPPSATGSPRTGGALDEWYHELAWIERALPVDVASPAAGAGDDGDGWVVVSAEPDALAAAFGPAARAVSVADAAGGAALTGATHVVFAPAATRTDFGALRAHELFGDVRRVAAALASTPGRAHLTILTRNAQPVADGEPADPAQAVLWGFARTLALENPEIFGRILDVDAALPAALAARHVRAELDSSDGEDQVVLRAGRRLLPRLRAAVPPTPLTGLPGYTTALVVGATGNVGPDLIVELSRMGADTIVALSRSGADLSAEVTAELAANSTTLVNFSADAAHPEAMRELFARFGNDLPPLDGVYVAALAGGAGSLIELDDAEVDAMFRPKVDAISVLHELTVTTPVRRFVLFSSITGLFGSRWLGHYTAANSFADAFAFARRAVGLPATVIDWGLWKSWADAQPETASAGLTPMRNETAIATLPTLLGADAPIRPIVVGAQWARLAEAYRMRTSFHIVDDLLGEADHDLSGLPPARPDTVLGEVDSIETGTVETSAGDSGAGAAEVPSHTWFARIADDELPYPGSHLVHGVEVVPASVLLHTVATVVAQAGAAGAKHIAFTQPLILDRPRVVRVRLDETGAITIASATSVGAGPHEWVEHLSAGLLDSEAPPIEAARTATGFSSEQAAELEQHWGLSGRPYAWTALENRSAPGTLEAGVSAAGTAALLDATVHLARLIDASHDGLMFPAAVETMTVSPTTADGEATVEVRYREARRGGFAADVTAGAGAPFTVDLRGLCFVPAAPAAGPAIGGAPDAAVDAPDWELLSEQETRSELVSRMRVILARELGMPTDAVRSDQPFPELGLDSMMAMTVLRDARHLVGLDLSATMLWNHPTIDALSEMLTGLLAPRREATQAAAAEAAGEQQAEVSVLDSLFDSVESLSDPLAGSESLSDTQPVSAVPESGQR